MANRHIPSAIKRWIAAYFSDSGVAEPLNELPSPVAINADTAHKLLICVPDVMVAGTAGGAFDGKYSIDQYDGAANKCRWRRGETSNYLKYYGAAWGIGSVASPVIEGEDVEFPWDEQTWNPSGAIVTLLPSFRLISIDGLSAAINLQNTFFQNRGLYPVTVGDADSAGSGFRALRIPNEV